MSIRITNISRQKSDVSIESYGMARAERVRAFHAGFPQYAPTPLVSLDGLADHLRAGNIWVKDESKRFGLNAFKVLGGSYAIGRCIGQRLNIEESELNYDLLMRDDIRARLGEVTFITATDGNHGRGVAWTAKCLHKRCIVYMPSGTARERLENIRALGADASILDCNYDGCVARAMGEARERGYILVQDTAMRGYTQIPEWIMQGYTTMGIEALDQLGGRLPTHLFLQAGVGSMAAAMTALFRSAADAAGQRLTVVIVEPHQANCIFRTAEANDGKLHTVTGDMPTIMAGLACGVPCTTAWDILRADADFCVSMGDEIAARGMRVLGNPMGTDARIISGESGASAFGFAITALSEEKYRLLLGLDAGSRVLCFSTEGDTDRENYRKIVWDGAYPNGAL